MPDGTLVAFAPIAGSIGHLVRTAIDAEQVGATRLHLPADQPEMDRALSAIREQTRLIITCDRPVDGADVIASGFVDVVVEDNTDLPELVAAVARTVSDHPDGVAITGRGGSALPALLAALAAGGHVCVEPGPVKDHVALIARASGLARIAGRPPLDRQSAGRLLGLR